MFKLGRSPFKETHWVVTSFKVTCYVQVGSFAFQRDTLGCHLVQSDMLCSSWTVRLSKRHVAFSPRSKQHVMFKLGRLPFKETRWVVTSFKVTCYVQVGSSAFQRDMLGCHLVQSNILGRLPFKETRWVVTSFKVTCYSHHPPFKEVHYLHCAILHVTSKPSRWT
ncbi:hypothetical protein KY289_024116 [Solanum tuberosum]|nr:hypothetical protein KY289_024116 [Solanum tuberosum]